MLRRSVTAAFALLLLTSPALARSTATEATQARSFPVPPIRARAAVVLNADNGRVLGAQNAHLRLPMASTTKIMTAIVALQVGHLSDRITVSKWAFNFESDATVMGLHPGNVVSLRDLLYGLLLPSGADAANAIAIHYGGSEAAFVKMMNGEAAQLGLHDTHYANAHGLTSPNHYTSAYDLALLGQFAAQQPELLKITSTREHRWSGHLLTNLNRVLFWYPGLDGIKPGYTDDAGICQVLDARRHNRHVIVTILNTPDLVIDARNLLNFGLRDFSWVQSPLPGDAPSAVFSGVDRSGSYSYFPGSGHYVRSGMWKAYLGNGGYAALGFPRTETLLEPQGTVQYFENGALASNRGTGRVKRLALGLTPLPGASPVPSPSPTPTVTPVLTPREGTVTLPGVKQAKKTPTPAPPPGIVATSTPIPKAGVATVFQPFVKAHKSLLGRVAGTLFKRQGYRIQVFSYGALLYDAKHRATYLLPIGDRLLASRRFLPSHPGNRYPPAFAPEAVLRTIGWPPYGAG